MKQSKKKNSKKELEIQLKRYKKYYNLIALLSIFLLIIMGYVCSWSLDNKFYSSFQNKNISNIEVQFKGDFSPEEKDLVYELYSHIEEDYLSIVKSITFTKEDLGDWGGDYAGINEVGEITLEFHNDENYLREILCHELIHGFLRLGKLEHKVVYDMGSDMICFDDVYTIYEELK